MGVKGKAGRKPLPRNVKVLRGTLESQRDNPAQPVSYLTDVPEPPSYLTAAEKTEWRRLAPVLVKAGIMGETDMDILANYCRVFARWKKAEKQLAKTGVIIKGKDGWFEPSPFLKPVNELLGQLRALMVELGMTPSSRSRIRVEGKAKQTTSDFEREYLNDG